MPKLSRTGIAIILVSIGVCATLVTSVAAVVALSDRPGDSRDRPIVVTDTRALSAWKSALGPAIEELNSFDDPPRVPSAEPARIRPCAIDESDGRLVQLFAGKYWTTEPTQQGIERTEVAPEIRSGYAEIVNSMEARGWVDGTGTRSDSEDGLTEPVRTTLSKSFGAVPVVLRIDMYADGIIARLTFPDAPRACRLAN